MSKHKNRFLQTHNNDERLQGTIVAQHFSGPLPPPSVLEHYERILPGAAERIITKFEHQTEHRLEIEKSVIRTSNFKEIAGLFCGFIVAMTTIGGGIYTAILGHSLLGGSLSFAGLAVLVGAFITWQKTKK
jgi:uncharacterized membrane protein